MIIGGYLLIRLKSAGRETLLVVLCVCVLQGAITLGANILTTGRFRAAIFPAALLALVIFTVTVLSSEKTELVFRAHAYR